MTPKKYSFLNCQKFSHKKYSLIPLRKQDIQKIKNWRNDQIKILRQKKPLTTNEQIDYFEKVIKNSFYRTKPKMILFSFLNEDICIGYGGLVHIDWKLKTAEISIITDTKRTKSKSIYQKDLSIFLRLISEIAFNYLNFKKLTTETYDVRSWVIEILEKMSFRQDKILKNHIMIDGKLHNSIIHSKFSEIL